MRTKKMSLASIQGKLSRTEMKKIMAGSEEFGSCSQILCQSGSTWCSEIGHGCGCHDTICRTNR